MYLSKIIIEIVFSNAYLVTPESKLLVLLLLEGLKGQGINRHFKNLLSYYVSAVNNLFGNTMYHTVVTH